MASAWMRRLFWSPSVDRPARDRQGQEFWQDYVQYLADTEPADPSRSGQRWKSRLCLAGNLAVGEPRR